MNYNNAARIYREHNLTKYLTAEYFSKATAEINTACKKSGIECQVIC
jgi:hypothetical protein